MQHMSTKLLLSGSMLLGAVSAQAALPPEATKTPSAAAVTLMHAILKSSA